MKSILSYPLMVSMALGLSACGGSSSSTDVADTGAATDTTTPLTIDYAARSGSTEINCDATLTGLGTSGDSGKMKYFAYYIHDIELVDNAGTAVDATLVDNDFQDPENGVVFFNYRDKDATCGGTAEATNKQVKLDVKNLASHTISKIRFKVGVPFAVNHDSSLNNQTEYASSDYYWNWQGGRKMMRMDVAPTKGIDQSGNAGTNWNFHLGSIGCTSADATTAPTEACSSPNVVQIELDNFTASDGIVDTVVFDYQKLIAGVDMNNDAGGKFGCMSFPGDPECISMLSKLGLTYTKATGATQNIGTQTVFSVEK